MNSIIQYCKYNDVEPKIRKSLHIYHTMVSTRDHILTVDEARRMYKIGSLQEKVMVKIWLLGLRIEDACKLEWKKMDIYQILDEPKEVLVNTQKEGVAADCFLDKELQELLTRYIPTLNKNNPFLFQTARLGHLSEKQLRRRLQRLQKKKAMIEPQGTFGWHIARKLFLRTCAENGVNSWAASMMVGKTVASSIATYIQGAKLREEAKKVLNVLRMEPVQFANTTSAATLSLIMEVLRRLIGREMKESGMDDGTLNMILIKPDEEILKEYLQS